MTLWSRWRRISLIIFMMVCKPTLLLFYWKEKKTSLSPSMNLSELMMWNAIRLYDVLAFSRMYDMLAYVGLLSVSLPLI